MGLFDFFKKPKTDLEKYYEERKRREEQEAVNNAQYDSYSSFDAYSQPSFSITVEDVFTITGRGTVIVGRVACGSVHTGETVILQRLNGSTREVTITGIEKFRKVMECAKEGENVGILLRGITKNDIGKGDILKKN